MSSVGIVGLGVVGSAVRAFFSDSAVYDPAKGETDFTSLLDRSVVFLCLPTLYDARLRVYNCSAIRETLGQLSDHAFSGLIVLKSTVTPGTTREMSVEFPALRICHCPEFLSAATAVEDFRAQTRLLIGRGRPSVDVSALEALFPTVPSTVCTSDETEATKLFCNSFYAAKVQIFNELYDACQRTGMAYETIRTLMVGQGWIHPMHTQVPGPDGQLSFGGMCFPKDLSACVSYLESIGAKHGVLQAVKEERDSMRG